MATASLPAHSACPQLQAMDINVPALSQYVLQYLLPLGTGHSHPGWAHLSGFLLAIDSALFLAAARK